MKPTEKSYEIRLDLDNKTRYRGSPFFTVDASDNGSLSFDETYLHWDCKADAVDWFRKAADALEKADLE